MLFFYDLFILFSQFAIKLAAPFYPKARLWTRGRKGWVKKLEAGLAGLKKQKRPVVWIHCASLGEFEQGRPLIEAIKAAHPRYGILLTFFSPSGFEIRKDYPLADHVAYLPADTRRNAGRFLDSVQPCLVIFVKYEFWFHHLHQVQKRNIPLFLVSALFRPGQLFFRPWGGPFRRLLTGFTHIFVQNAPASALLRELGLENHSLAGDTRVDRVFHLAHKAKRFPLVEEFSAGHLILIAGSTWPPDEALLAPLINGQLPENWKVIIAPHLIRENSLKNLEARISLPNIRFSKAGLLDAASCRVLIIDNIGMLSSLYQYGRLAYIGGGFGVAIHNVLEPVAFGLPALFGPRYRKFEEAVQLVRRGGAFPVETAAELSFMFHRLEDEATYEEASREARKYIEENKGATEKIMHYIDQWLREG